MSGGPVLDCPAVRDLAGLYALGALEPAEAIAVREHLAGCALGHPELDEDAATATALLATVEPVEPPPALRARLLAAAADDLREGRHPAAVVAVPQVAAPRPTDLRRGRRREVPGSRWMALGLAAALLVAVALGGWNVALQGRLAEADAYRAGVDAALDLAAAPGSATALLASEDGSVGGLGVVGANGEVRLALRGLPSTAGSQVYAAWAIGGDGVPRNIGEFTVGAGGAAAVRASAPGAAPGTVLALTLEARAGATAPTLPIVVSGEARAASG